MRKRVTQDEDYLPQIAAEIERARAKDPNAAFPWEWWRAQAEKYGVTPNNIYSRAQRLGIYTPPRKDEAASLAPSVAKKAVPADTSDGSKRERVQKRDRESPPPSGADLDAAPSETLQRPKAKTAPARPGGASAPSARLLTERLHAMAEIADVLGEMEERIHSLERERETDAAKNREAVRALDRLARVLDEASGTVAALRQLYED